LNIGISIKGNLVYTDVDFAPLMEDAGRYMLGSVLENFSAGGRPTPWAPLANGERSHLFGGGDLASRIYDTCGANWAEVRAPELPYSAIHQFGGTTHPTFTDKMRRFMWARWYQTKDAKWKAIALRHVVGEKLNVRIPARPYLMFQEEDIDYLHKMFQDSIIKFINANGRPINV